jgi:hypothetical protein
MNASTLFDPYSAHSTNHTGWRDWACWVPGRTHEDPLHHPLAPAAAVPTDETAMTPQSVLRIDVAAQGVGVQ